LTQVSNMVVANKATPQCR